MRKLILLGCLPMSLLGCGGDTSVALYIHWGDCDFDRDRWSQADRSGRACMLASLLEKHPPGSMTAVEVKALLGEPTGYAGIEADPAYLVEPAGGRGSEGVLVYRTDPRSGRIVGAELITRP